ncbi:MAG: leader peptide processing enzyme [Treponema sp.]|jgi:hypothetical protein|nr:leader peptide processing enzyme [Treponema sp.]
MTAKTRLLLFMLAATAFNIAATVIFFTALLLFYSFLLVPRLPPGAASFGPPVLFAVSVVLSFVIYRRLLAAYLKKRSPGQ